MMTKTGMMLTLGLLLAAALLAAQPNNASESPRETFAIEKSEPSPAALHLDDGSLDFWLLR